MRKSLGEKTFDSFNIIFMAVLSFVMIFPFWYVLMYSLNETNDAASGGIWFYPRAFTLSNYSYVLLNPLVLNAYVVTIARTVSGAFLHLVVTGLAAYALSKRYLPGRKWLIRIYILPMFIGGTIVSNYVVMAQLRLLNNFLVYVLPAAFSFFMMVIMRTFIEQIPASLEESAKMDGAGYLRIFFQLIVPVCSPIIATVLIYSAVHHWLDFYSNLLYISNPKLDTLQYLLYRIVQQSQVAALLQSMGKAAQRQVAKERITPQTLKMTTLIVITLPILFVYPFFQKYIIKGVLLGSIKE